MNGHSESTGKASVLSSDSVRRVTQYQPAGTNARWKLFALLEAQGVPAAEADDLVAALGPGRWLRRSARWLSWTAWRRPLRTRCSRTAGMRA